MNIGLMGGIVGGAIGLAAGLVGTYLSIKNTDGPRERAFMVKASVVCWIAMIAFLGLMLALPSPYRHLLWILYATLLPLGIVLGNLARRRIGRDEARNQQGEAPR